MRVRTKKRLILWIAFILLGVVTICSLHPAGNKLTKMQILQLRSQHQLKAISRWIIQYKKSNVGESPKNLSDLISDEQSYRLEAFQAPSLSNSDIIITNRNSVNVLADYSISTNEISRIIAFEKPGLWADDSVAICLDDLSVYRLKIADFKMLHKIRCGVLRRSSDGWYWTLTEESVATEQDLKTDNRTSIRVFHYCCEPNRDADSE